MCGKLYTVPLFLPFWLNGLLSPISLLPAANEATDAEMNHGVDKNEMDSSDKKVHQQTWDGEEKKGKSTQSSISSSIKCCIQINDET